MELRQLAYFIAVSESGAFSRAALRLGVGQPILSRQIAALEKELGTELYHRTGRGIVLSEAGKLLERYARGILESTEGAKREIHALEASPAGPVVIGMPPSIGSVLTVPLVRHFMREFPKASLNVVEGFSGHVLEWLLSGQIDVAVLYNAPRLNVLQTTPLLTDEVVLLGPASDPARAGSGPVRGARLADIPLILPSRPHGLRVLFDEALSGAGIVPNVKMEINAMPSTLSLVESGLGYTILSYSCVHHLVAAGRIKCWPLVEPALTRTLVVATSTQRPTRKIGQALLRIVREQAHALEKTGHWRPMKGAEAGETAPKAKRRGAKAAAKNSGR